MKRNITVLASRRGEIYRTRGEGTGYTDEQTVHFEPDGNGTRLTIDIELNLRGGFLGRLYERTLGNREVEKRAQDEIARFVALAQRPDVDASVGDLLTVDCGAGFRVVHVLAVSEEVVHVALDPGVSKARPTVPIADANRAVQLPVTPTPLVRPVSAALRRIQTGQSMLALDGGLGVPHMALTRAAVIDALPLSLGERPVPADTSAEIDAWSQLPDAPVFGRDLEIGLGPLVAMPFDEGFRVAKVLRTDRGAVHVRVYSDRWTDAPVSVNAWTLRLDPMGSESVGIGHMPLSTESWRAARPQFLRLAMVGRFELEGVREWEAAGGGVFG
jgi:hypothetical protein